MLFCSVQIAFNVCFIVIIITQQLIKKVDDLLPGLCSFFPGKFREVGSSVVNVQAVDALQHDGDHSLRRKQKHKGGPKRLCMHHFRAVSVHFYIQSFY